MYRTLHALFFGADKVSAMVNDILSSLKLKVYQGDHKNFNFDKNCLAHVAEHNHHASLVENGVAALEESMKIHYFEEGIKDPTLEAAWNAILVNRMQFPDFDSVMQLYVTSKRGQKSEAAVHQGRQLSAVTGRGRGRGRGGASHGGRGRGDPDARQRGLVSQADIDKVTTIENKHYPKEVYAKFSAAEKAKHWQLRNPGKERSTGPTDGKKTGISATNISEFAWLFLRFLTTPSKLPMKRRPTMTHPTAKTLPWFTRARSPNPITHPLPLANLLFEPFAWQLTLDVILLTLVLK